MFGDNTAVLQTEHEDEKDHTLKIPIIENGVEHGVFRLDFQTGIVSMTDTEGNLLFQEQLDKENSARFTTMDPMAEKYYSISPYVYCANNPLKFTDPNGDTIRISIYNSTTNAMDSYYYGADTNGNRGFIGVNGSLYAGNDAFVGSLTTALGKLSEKSAGRGLVDDLASSTNTVTMINGSSNAAGDDGTYVRWNEANTNPSSPRPGFVGLGHEMAHIQAKWNNIVMPGTMPALDGKNRDSEIYTVHMENQIRVEHGIALRTHYAYTPSGSGLEATRMINATTSTSLFYTQPQTHSTTRIVNGMPVTTSTIVHIPFVYKGY